MTTKKYYSIDDLQKRLGPMTMARALHSWRQSEEMSQVDFAKKLGISKANLCDIEKGRKLVSPERAAKIAKIIGVSEDLFIKISLEDLLRQANLHYSIEVKLTKKRNSAA